MNSNLTSTAMLVGGVGAGIACTAATFGGCAPMMVMGGATMIGGIKNLGEEGYGMYNSGSTGEAYRMGGENAERVVMSGVQIVGGGLQLGGAVYMVKYGGVSSASANVPGDEVGIKAVISGPNNSKYVKIDYLMGRVDSNVGSISKGRFFNDIMGFTDDTLTTTLKTQLTDNIGNTIKGSSQYGKGTVSVRSQVTSPTGKQAFITSVWQLDNNTYNFVTAYPD